jgi:hypothetical protein
MQLNRTGTDSPAGTIVHESSHVIANREIYKRAYGEASAKVLARSNSAQSEDINKVVNCERIRPVRAC